VIGISPLIMSFPLSTTVGEDLEIVGMMKTVLEVEGMSKE
jgi:hypothetical protein